MKYQIKLLLGFLLIAARYQAVAQDEEIKLHPHFFSLRNSKISLGLALEGSPASFMINGSKPKDFKVLYKDQRSSSKNYPPYGSFGICFDFYSDNSLTGLMAGVNWTYLEQTFQSGDTASDFMDMTRLEFPLYLKFRPGYYNDTSHLWLLFGGVYSMGLTCDREHHNPPSSIDPKYIDNDKTQLNSVFSLSVSLGYEFYMGEGKNSRGAFFVTGYYPLTSYINKEYKDFKSGGKSVLAHYPDFDIKDFRIAIGLKFLFGFKKVKS